MPTRTTTFSDSVAVWAFVWPLRTFMIAALICAGVLLAGVTVQIYSAGRPAQIDPSQGLAAALAIDWRTASIVLQRRFDENLDRVGTLSGGLLAPLPIAAALARGSFDWTIGLAIGMVRGVMHLPERWRHLVRQAPAELRPAARPDDADAAPAIVAPLGEELSAIVAAMHLVALRTACLLAALPLAMLLAGVALVDGWSARAIRRAHAGRESAGLYHRAKLLFWVTLSAGWMTAVCLTSHWEPLALAVVTAAALALSIRMQTALAKKYL
jgi:Domain of unknown function (DUF4400)